MYWDVYVMQGNHSVGMVYALTETEALRKAWARWGNRVVYVSVYRG